MNLREQLDAVAAKKAQGDWFPANAGTETSTTYRTGRRLLYCWQPTTGRHAYLDCSSDLILTDDEAHFAKGVYVPVDTMLEFLRAHGYTVIKNDP